MKMDELSALEKLFERWMIYNTRTEPQALLEYIHLFISTYQDLIDCDFKHLEEGFSEEGPHLTKLPENLLQVLGNQLNSCCYGDNIDNFVLATRILQCLVVLCRNYDNVPFIASCEFASYAVNVATVVISKGFIGSESYPVFEEFLKVTLHLFECLYDPYFTWRKRYRGQSPNVSRTSYKPAALHVEIVPFIHECFQHHWLPSDIKVRLVHVFGAIISGAQHNALMAISPAMLDILLRVLGTSDAEKPTNELRAERNQLTCVLLECIVAMVRVIHMASPDQRQVEVSQLLEGYMQVLQSTDTHNVSKQLDMIDTVGRMLQCEDRNSLQIIMTCEGTVEGFLNLLQNTQFEAEKSQRLAIAVLGVLRSILTSSPNAKFRFSTQIGYNRLLEALKSLGQPSQDLLLAVLSLVVEGPYIEAGSHHVANSQCALLLIQWLPDIQSHDLQTWLTELLWRLCGSDHTNKMSCCKAGMIACILTVLVREQQINSAAVGHLIGLLESLGTQSITAMELKQLIGLLKLDPDGKQYPHCSRLMHAMSTMARREGKEGALHFFNIQDISDGIRLPGIRKWLGYAFSFHAWLCLSTNIDHSVYGFESTAPYRRTLYSFLSNSGSGFEAFFKHTGELTIAVFSKKDHSAVTVPDLNLLDGYWHNVCIIHTNAKRPFVSSQLYVYADGKLRHNTPLRYPNMGEPFTACQVGAPVQGQQAQAEDGASPDTPAVKRISPFKFLSRSRSKPNSDVPGMESTAAGSHDDQCGLPLPLIGQIGSVCVLHEALTAVQVKCLYKLGPNSLEAFSDKSELLDLPGKMTLYYNARACKASKITDLSSNQNDGTLSGQKCVTWDIKDVINCIGGIQVLFPLLEQVNRLHLPPLPPLRKSSDGVAMSNLLQPVETDQWVVLPSSSYADMKLEQNQVAGFLTLLRNMIQTKLVNQQTFVQTNGAAVIGALLQKVDRSLIDVNVLMAVQLLIEATAASDRTLVQHVYQYILFDFRIWSSSNFDVRIGHIQYLSTIIKDDKRYFRKIFGVQYVLDVIRTFYSTSSGLSEEDARIIRVSLMGLVKYFILKKVTVIELAAIFAYMMASKEENMITETLDMLINLLEVCRKQDQLYLLMFEPDIGEMLYGLLTLRGFTIVYYEKIVKVLYMLLRSDKVYEKSKSRLRLVDCGYLGLISLVQGVEISGPTIKRFLEQVSFTESPHMYGAVLAILQLIYRSGFDIKLEASRQLLSILVSNAGSARQFAKQIGWQELLTHLFILSPLESKSTNASAEKSIGAENVKGMSDLIDFDETGDDSNFQTVKSEIISGIEDGFEVEAFDLNESREGTHECSMLSGEETFVSAMENDSDVSKGSEQVQNSSGEKSMLETELVQEEMGNLKIGEDHLYRNDLDTEESEVFETSSEATTKSVHCDSQRDIMTDCDKDCDNRVIYRREGDEVRGDDAAWTTPVRHPDSLNLRSRSSQSLIEFSDALETPSTPMYLQQKNYFDLNLTANEDDFHHISRSSSASMEDLNSSGIRGRPVTKAESTTSLSSEGKPVKNEDESIEMRSELKADTQTSITPSRSNPRLSLAANPERDNANTVRDNTNTERDSKNMERMLDSLGLRGSFMMKIVEDTEELCQNLLIVLFTVMWKGVEGSDQAAWKERCLVLRWLDKLSDGNNLLCPVEELKRRLLEMMLHACTSELKDSGHITQTYMENSIQLMKLVWFFLTQNSSAENVYGKGLLEDVLSLLDTLAVWDVQTGAGWQDMVHLGLSVIVSFTQRHNLELCAIATARLHTLIQTKLISSSAEASFLIGHLNTVIIGAVNAESDNYSFLIPVLKALIEKSHQLLNLDVNLPSLPSTNLSPTFFDDFKSYCKTAEWEQFIEHFIEPQKQHFIDSVFTDMSREVANFWLDCHSDMLQGLHRLNRERGESKLKFQDQILAPFAKKITHERKRFQNMSTQLRNQHSAVLRQWRAKKTFFIGERGAWANRSMQECHWKLSNQENFSRMKVKLIQNYHFDVHREAAMLRDNTGVESINILEELRHLSVTKEALVSKENMGDDGIGDEDWTVISAQSSTAEVYGDKEKLVLTEECELVTLQEVIKGRLEVTTTHVYFFDCSTIREDGGEDFKWSLPQLREIHFRRYNLRRSALEMFLVDQTNYFLNFEKKVRNKVYSRILSLRPPNLIYYGSRSPAELLKASGLTQKWVQREISNFEYLMQLNTIAGRTYNDLSQYPVFPWILCDYTSATLDLDNPAVFRDLSKPVGVLNPRNEEDIREKFDHFEDPHGVIEKFHYGTHYSNAATVMHYMIRMEPFTTLHIALQSGRFDVSDRQFHSIPGTWKSMYNNPNDVKELIPEFFYLPEFLVNSNGFDLGQLQISHDRVNDVLLPAWAETPEDFIHQHRKALECEHVSRNLHNWIDLIFGFKQKGPAAVEALNVFYYCTYEGAVDLDAVKNDVERKALEGMINNFGQTPCQLLRDPHPRRLTFDDLVVKAMKTDRHLSLFYFLENLKVYFVEVSGESDPLVFVCVPRSQPKSIIQHGMLDTMVTVSSEGILGFHGWLPYEKAISNYFTFDKDPSVTNQKTRKRFSTQFAPGLKVTPNMFVVTHDCKLMISGGHWDNSLQVYHVGKNKRLAHICRHIDIVTCLALDYCGSHLISGSRDTTCIIWHIEQQGGVCVNISPKPLQTLYGHDNEVSAVHISSELDLAVSASKDGTVMMHTVRKGNFIRTLRPECRVGCSLDIPVIAVNDMGQVIVYSRESQPVNTKDELTLHLFSLNGKLLCTRTVNSNIGHMICKGEHLITGDDQGNITVYELFRLRQLTSLPLYVPVHCLAITNGNSHIMAGLRDGKLIIIGIKSPNEVR